MKQKDLAEEYLTKAKENAIYFKDGNFPNMPLYQEKEIKAAFNAGRDSVVENISELEWKDNDIAIEEEFALCAVGRYEVSHWDELFEVWCNSLFLGYRPSLSEAKQAANGDYKKRIKQALGL